jgi:hypothetical protein
MAGIHRSIDDPRIARIDLSRVRGLPMARTRTRRSGSPSVDDGG